MNNLESIYKIRNYFANEYPACSSFWGSLFFRHGECERAQIVRKWIPSTRGLSILDIGCGDGKFLSSIISGYPKKIVIEDIFESIVLEAYQNLKYKANIVEKRVCNSLIEKSNNFDLVLLIGVLDFYPNWEEVIKNLLLCSHKCIIVNIPRKNHLRNWVRFLWFFFHGIQLQMLSQKRLKTVMDTKGISFEIQPSRLEWFVRILPNNS